MKNRPRHGSPFLSSIPLGLFAALVALSACQGVSQEAEDDFDAGGFIGIDAATCSEADCLKPVEETNAAAQLF